MLVDGEKPVNVKAVAQSQTTILLTWQPPNPTLGHLKAFHFYINGKHLSEIAGPEETSKLFTQLTPFTEYSIGIASENDLGSSADGIGDIVTRTVTTWPTGKKQQQQPQV